MKSGILFFLGYLSIYTLNHNLFGGWSKQHFWPLLHAETCPFEKQALWIRHVDKIKIIFKNLWILENGDFSQFVHQTKKNILWKLNFICAVENWCIFCQVFRNFKERKHSSIIRFDFKLGHKSKIHYDTKHSNTRWDQHEAKHTK